MFPLRTLPPIGVPPSPAFFLTAVLLPVVGFLAFCSTAVAWHRLILLGEQPPAIYVGLGGPVMRYLGRCLLIALVALPIILLCAMLLLPLVAFRLVEMLPAPPSPFTPPSLGHILVLSIVNLVVLLPALLVTSRLVISLPGIAIGRPMTLSEAWQSTAGNTGRLLGGTLLVCAPPYVIGLAIQLATWPPRWPPSGNLMAAVLLNFLVGFLVAVAAISFLSLSYRFLVGTAQPGQPQAD